ncbi:MAG: aspartate/glutamate racemase family protein [Desulfovibrio sp.]|nr:aspartate/glutamate racemase family protein [Desulfovibrio sp.]
MKKRLVLLHSVGFIADLFKPLLVERVPELECIHIVDEGILCETAKAGGLTPCIVRRIAVQALLASDLRPDMILFTCSATSPAVDFVRGMVSMPVMKIDDPLADAALREGNSIAFIGTTKGSLGPGVDLIRTRAISAGKNASVTPVLLESAFAARTAGNIEEHDRIVGGKAREMAVGHDVVVLGQASMSHLADPLRRAIGKPVLGSVSLCLEELKKLL